MAAKIPKEQERVKNFRKSHGATKVGEVTVDMVSSLTNQNMSLSVILFSVLLSYF